MTTLSLMTHRFGLAGFATGSPRLAGLAAMAWLLAGGTASAQEAAAAEAPVTERATADAPEDTPENAASDEATATTEEAEAFELPEDATEQEALQVLQAANNVPAASNKPADVRAHYLRLNELLTNILGREYSDDLLQSVAIGKYENQNVLIQLGDEAAGTQQADFVASLSKSDREPLARAGRALQALRTVTETAMSGTTEPQRWKSSTTQLDEYLSKATTEGGQLSVPELRVAMTIAQILESAAPNEVAGPAYNQIAKALKGSENPQVQEIAEMFEATARKVNLVGSPIEITGTTLDGKPFDIQKDMRGKIVVVDFWATWCGFCIEAFPEMKRLHAEHKDEGFEIVGVNLDDTKTIVDDYLGKNPLPWTNIQNLGTDGEPAHPNARRYDVRGIPFLVLVGRDGKVIARDVTADTLEDKLLAALKAQPQAEKPADESTDDESPAEQPAFTDADADE